MLLGKVNVHSTSLWYSINSGGKFALVALCAIALTACSNASRETTSGDRAGSETYNPGIWVDPDGCEHYILDDGFEGYMTPNLNADGTPVCRNVVACGTLYSDQYFTTGSAVVNSAGRRKLEEFFNGSNAFSHVIVGHTDSRASDQYNLSLSKRRAEAVASVARATGARVSSVRGNGERNPIASNATEEGRKLNRRVDIFCAQNVTGEN